MKTIIRAAVDSGRPPLELLLDRPNRPRSKWDGKLIKALYMNEAFDIDGHPIWVEESKDIDFQLGRRVFRSKAIVQKAEEDHRKKKNPERGVQFYAKPVLKPGKKWPTRAGWLKKQDGPDVEDLQDEKMLKRAAEAEERAAAKAAADPEVQRILDQLAAQRKGTPVD